jgi:hypothetical protein
MLSHAQFSGTVSFQIAGSDWATSEPPDFGIVDNDVLHEKHLNLRFRPLQGQSETSRVILFGLRF